MTTPKKTLSPLTISNTALQLVTELLPALGIQVERFNYGERSNEDVARQINLVVFVFYHREATVSQFHAHWCRNKIADGWKFADIENRAEKESDLIRPYYELSTEWQKTFLAYQEAIKVLLNVDISKEMTTVFSRQMGN